MNEADKPKLKHALSKLLSEVVHVTPSNSKYILDNGSLLHKVPWTVGCIFQKYLSKNLYHIETSQSICFANMVSM